MNTFKKYVFGLIVTSYLTTVIGIPVYLHYCGGELEDVSYVIKKISCCGSEEEEGTMTMNGCCQDQNLVIRLATDFTVKKAVDFNFINSFTNLFFISLPFYSEELFKIYEKINLQKEFPPPKLQNSLLISTSILKI